MIIDIETKEPKHGHREKGVAFIGHYREVPIWFSTLSRHFFARLKDKYEEPIVAIQPPQPNNVTGDTLESLAYAIDIALGPINKPFEGNIVAGNQSWYLSGPYPTRLNESTHENYYQRFDRNEWRNLYYSLLAPMWAMCQDEEGRRGMTPLALAQLAALRAFVEAMADTIETLQDQYNLARHTENRESVQ